MGQERPKSRHVRLESPPNLHGGSAGRSSSDATESEPPHLTPFQGQELSIAQLQTLSTSVLHPVDWNNSSLDIITGCQIVHGENRLVILEGLPDKGMSLIAKIGAWALLDPKPSLDWLFDPPQECSERRVLYNPQLKWGSR